MLVQWRVECGWIVAVLGSIERLIVRAGLVVLREILGDCHLVVAVATGLMRMIASTTTATSMTLIVFLMVVSIMSGAVG